MSGDRILKHRLILCAFVSAAFACIPAVSQIAADLKGRVTDPSGAGVANATVELTNSATSAHQRTTSSPSGDYWFTNLNPGQYELDVTAEGFDHLTRTGVSANVGQTISVDLTLRVGGNRQTVAVNADAPLLQSETSNIQTNIAGPTVVAMPLNTRNFVQLATLAPGVELPPGTRCCRASTADGHEPTNICLTGFRRCNLNRDRWHSSQSRRHSGIHYRSQQRSR